LSTDLILIRAVRLKKKYEEYLRIYLESRKPEIEATFLGRMVSGRWYAFIVDGIEVRDGALYKRASFDSMTYRGLSSLVWKISNGSKKLTSVNLWRFK